MAIQKSPAPPSRSSLLRRIRALEARLEELDDPHATGEPGPHRAASDPDPATDVAELVASGRVLSAARRYREITGCDEAQARAAIEILGGDTAHEC